MAKFADPVQNLPTKICREINQNPYLGQDVEQGEFVSEELESTAMELAASRHMDLDADSDDDDAL